MRLRLSIVLLACLLLVFAAGYSKAPGSKIDVSANGAGATLYLPLVVQMPVPVTPAGIYGLVTYNGDPAGGLTLDLRHWDGANYTTQATTTTGSDGRYSFTGAPSLAVGHSYYVRFTNDSDPSYVFGWYNPDIVSYTAGDSTPGGDFDIANVFLASPGNGYASPLPITFQWTKRGIAGDTYAFGMFDLGTGDAWTTADLGAVSSFTMNSLPTGANFGQQYGWYALVFKDYISYKDPISYGESYDYRRFTANAAGPANASPAQSFHDKVRADARRVQTGP